ncbi:MAG TPA: hybrid sensor histidine kinase/response regulator, partial [Spirochaetota bacterium]|nr:hybrid sensor histidine kinase/response regulator [Spirochaetota bacterium]
MSVIKQKILIVDDAPVNIKVLGYMLKDSDYEVLISNNSKNGLEIAQNNLPDLILLDINMPEMDGYEFCKLIKGDKRTKDIVIIFLTAKTETDEIVKGFEMGAEDYVTKPFNSGELLARIRTHLSLKQKNYELQLLNKKLDEANKLKNRFFSIISHDLRSPFTTLMGIPELLIQRYDSFDKEKILEYIKKIYSSGKIVYNLLDNLLEWSRSQLDNFNITITRVNLKDIIENVFLSLKDIASNKNINLICDLTSDLFVNADIYTITTVIRNLVSNSIKFTKNSGFVKITYIELENEFEICIEDNGIGISKDNIEKLFSSDTNFSKNGTNGEKGTGLGLIICKEFIEKNGGNIRVESEENIGTKFLISLTKNFHQ